MRRLFIVFSILFAGMANADELPCGPVSFVQHSFSFVAPTITNATPIDSYYLYIGTTPNQSVGPVNLGLLTPDQNGVITFTPSPVFDTSKNYFVRVSARGPGGESAKSNEVHVFATSSGVCPPPAAPGAPSQLELVQ